MRPSSCNDSATLNGSNRVPLSLLTNSEAKTYKRCPREHHLAYRLGYRPRTPAAALSFGSMIHRGLERWWLAAKEGWRDADRLASALTSLDQGNADPFDRIRAEELLLGYHARWASSKWEVLEVEVEFVAPLIDPSTGEASCVARMGGKIDAIARGEDGLVYIVEHKTSGEDIELGSDYWRRLRLDSQISTYFVGGRSLGFAVAGCLYDVIGKPKLAPLKATLLSARKYTKDDRLYATQREEDEAPEDYRLRYRQSLIANPDRYFVRGIVPRLEADEFDAALDLWQLSETIADAERLSRYPRNDQSCVSWGRTCGFFPVCTREATLDDETKFRRVSRVHEELDQKEPSE